MRTEYTLKINAPKEKVFEFIDDPKKLKLWLNGLVDTKYAGSARKKNVGTKFKQRIKEGGRIAEYDGEVLTYEKPRHMAVRIGNRHFFVDVDYKLSHLNGVTFLDYSADVNPQTLLAKVMGTLCGGLTKMIIKKQMMKLKSVGGEKMKNILLALVFCLGIVAVFFPKDGFALTLPQLDPAQSDALFKTIAADLAFRPVQPATSYGLWGFSVGVTGISTNAGQSSALSSTGTSSLYAGDISLGLGIPFGLAVEAGILPTMSISGTNLSRFGIDGKWTLTDVLFDKLPFDAAVRAMYTNSGISYSQPLNGGTVNVNYTSNISGLNLSISKSLFIVDPWISYGLIQQSSNLSATGTSNLFDGNFPPTTSSISSSTTSGWFQLGVQVKILLFTAAAEYDNLFGSDSYSGRLAFTF